MRWTEAASKTSSSSGRSYSASTSAMLQSCRTMPGDMAAAAVAGAEVFAEVDSRRRAMEEIEVSISVADGAAAGRARRPIARRASWRDMAN